MFTRRFFLKAMLWALGAAACSGVLAVVVDDRDLVWRVTGTSGAAAFACAVMMLFAPLADHEKSRAAGIAGMWLCVIEFGLVVSLVWMPALGGWRGEEAVAWTMLFVAVCGLPGAVFLRLITGTGTRAAGWAGLVACGPAFVLFEIAVAHEVMSGWSSSTDWFKSGWLICTVGSAGALSLTRSDESRRRYWRVLPVLGVAGAAAAVVMGLYGIWLGTNQSPAPLVWAIACAATGAIAAVSLRVPLKPGQGWVRLGTVVAAAATGTLVASATAVGHSVHLDEDSFGLLRLAAGGQIVTVSGCFALAVLARLNRRTGFESNDTAITEITVICPRCGRKHAVAVGGAGGMCPGCRLRVSVRVRMPRCVRCDYDLSGITGDRCPECGAGIEFGAGEGAAGGA